MKYKYFNDAEFQYAQNIIETNPFEAKTRFENYLNKFPNDYYARAYYVLLLIRIGKINYAVNQYNYISNKIKYDELFYQSDKRTNGFSYIMALAKAKILACTEQFQELYDFYNNNKILFDNRGDTSLLSYFCRSKLGLIDKNDINENAPYRFLQVVDYNYDRFLNHIKKHQAKYNMDEILSNQSQFSNDFPIDEVLNEINKYIPSDKMLCLGLFDDGYYFKYNNCGHVKSKSTNFFKVSTFHNTHDYITMYPVTDCDNLPIIDLNYLILEQSTTKVKKISQIDKFNKRFNRG